MRKASSQYITFYKFPASSVNSCTPSVHKSGYCHSNLIFATLKTKVGAHEVNLNLSFWCHPCSSSLILTWIHWVHETVEFRWFIGWNLFVFWDKATGTAPDLEGQLLKWKEWDGIHPHVAFCNGSNLDLALISGWFGKVRAIALKMCAVSRFQHPDQAVGGILEECWPAFRGPAMLPLRDIILRSCQGNQARRADAPLDSVIRMTKDTLILLVSLWHHFTRLLKHDGVDMGYGDRERVNKVISVGKSYSEFLQKQCLALHSNQRSCVAIPSFQLAD